MSKKLEEIKDLDAEIWRDIKGYEGLYQVSNMGRILTTSRSIKRILGTYLNQYGYELVRLTKNKQMKRYLVHRLVGQHFIENPNNYPIIHHKNNIKNHNYVKNLSWATDKENSEFAWKDKRHKRTYNKGLVFFNKEIRSVPNDYIDKNFKPNDEIWVNVKNFESRYKISNYGRVKTIYKCGEKFLKPRICLIHANKKPLLVTLHKNGEKGQPYTLHKLVAIHFIPNPQNLETINHINGDKFNNKVNNLEWLSRQDNTRHALENGLIVARGEKHSVSKLKENEVLNIRKSYEIDKISMGKLSKIYNVTVTTISNVIKRKSWTHI